MGCPANGPGRLHPLSLHVPTLRDLQRRCDATKELAADAAAVAALGGLTPMASALDKLLACQNPAPLLILPLAAVHVQAVLDTCRHF